MATLLSLVRARHPLLRCFAIYRREPWLLALFIAISAVVQGAAPVVQTMVGRAIDDVIAGTAVQWDGQRFVMGTALVWAAWILGSNVVRALLGWAAQVVGMVLGQRLLSELRDRILVQIQRMDLAWHRLHGSGEMVTRTTRDADKVRDALIGGFRQIVEVTFIVAASLIALTFYHPLLAVVPLIAVIAAVLTVLMQVDQLVTLDRDVGDAYDHVTQDISEGVIGVRVIKAFGIEAARIERFQLSIDRYIGTSLRALRYAAIRLPIPQLYVATAHIWVLGYGAWLVMHDQMTIGTLSAAVMVVQALVFRIEPIGRLMKVFADARASAGRIIEVLDAKPSLVDGDRPMPSGPLGIQLRNVVVHSSDGRRILDGINADIQAGEIVALVGATGSGKSTLVELLSRLRDPDQGQVGIVDSHKIWHDVRELSLADVRRRVQIAFQDGFLFSDTLAANLRLADPQADDERLRWGLYQASAQELETTLTDGLLTRIGERGMTLSGGQRQRVCLARTFLAKPAFLCCDDATSALDAVTEKQVLDRLRASPERASVLLIASKMSTVLLADRVFVLANGRIVADGPHDELLANSAEYRHIIGVELTS